MMLVDFATKFLIENSVTEGENGRFLPLQISQITHPHPNHWDLDHFESERFTLVGRGVIWNWLNQAAVSREDFWHHFQEGFLADQLNFIAQLEGQFCFVLHDKREQISYAVRDQSGTYPLYYSNTTDGFVVSSRLTDIRPHLASVELSLRGVAHFLHFGYVMAPQTLLKDVFKLLRGECAICYANGSWEIICYWTVPAYNPLPKSPAAFLEETRQRMYDVVAKNIDGRERLGFFLSGGIDSSLLLAMLVNDFNVHPHTYTFGLNIDYKRTNYLRDLPYAREMIACANVAAGQELPYEELLIDHQFPIVSLLQEVVPQLDSLYITPNVMTKYWLAKQAAEQGVTTLMTGSCSPAGFDSYSEGHLRKKNFDHQRSFREMLPDFRKPILTMDEIGDLVPSTRFFANMLLYEALAPYWANLPGDDRLYQFEAALFTSKIIEKGVGIHIDLGRKVGIDFKIPLADSSFWKYKASVPRYLNAGNADYPDKFLLKEAFRATVPDSICDRPSNVGFPSYYWFQGELAALHRVLFSPEVLGMVPEMETAVLHQIVADEQCSTRKSKGKRTWGLTVFLLWYLHFIKGESLATII